MGDQEQKGRTRAQVRELFWREWNPIGSSVPRDEYDTYADKAYAMLMHEGCSAEEIAGYLFEISRERMGLDDDQRLRDLADKTAAKLMAFRSSSDVTN